MAIWPVQCSFWWLSDLYSVHCDGYQTSTMFIVMALWPVQCSFWWLSDLYNVHCDGYRTSTMFIVMAIWFVKYSFWWLSDQLVLVFCVHSCPITLPMGNTCCFQSGKSAATQLNCKALMLMEFHGCGFCKAHIHAVNTHTYKHTNITCMQAHLHTHTHTHTECCF